MEDILLNKNNPQIIGTIHKENKTFQEIPPPTTNKSQPTQTNSINI
jgi:hypothetical protein